MGIAGSSLDEEDDVSRERSPDYFSDENEEDHSPRRHRHRTHSGQSGYVHSPGERPQRVSIGTSPTELRTAAIGPGRLVPIPISNADGVGGAEAGEPRGASPRRVSAPHRVSTGSNTTANTSLGVRQVQSSEGVAGGEANHYYSERPQTLTLTPQLQRSPQNLSSDRSSSPGSHSPSPDPSPPAATAGTGDIRGATSTPSGGLATGLSGDLGATTPEPGGERNTDVQRSDVEPLPQGWTRRYVLVYYVMGLFLILSKANLLIQIHGQAMSKRTKSIGSTRFLRKY